ncbi:MAG: DUF1552 domain-containing protein [Gemmata sp.]
MSTRPSRRTFLRAGGVVLAVPMLEAMTPRGHAAPEKKPVKRFVCMTNNYGVYPAAFFPDPNQVGANYALPETLAPLEKHRADVTVFSNLDHGNTGGHQGVPVLLSGVKPINAPGFPEGNLSVDQKIAEWVGAAVRFPSLVLHVNEANLVSFTRTGVQVPSMDLRQLYRALFIDDEAAKKATAKQQLQRHRSILDVVRDEADEFQKGLGKQDRRKFDEYLDSVRTLEKKVEMQQPWVDKPKPKAPRAEPPVGKGTAADLTAMVELIALAIQTDSARAVTLASGFANGDFGLSGSYHGFSHHGQREKEVAALKQIEKNQIAAMALLIELLKKQDDPVSGGTLFDQTAILFGCGMATGEHSTKNLPLALAGGGFKHGEHKVYPAEGARRVPAANLLLSILRNHGLEVDRFGTSTGTLAGLEVRK